MRCETFSFLIIALFVMQPSLAEKNEFDPGYMGYLAGSASFSGKKPESEKGKRKGDKDNYRCKYYELAYMGADSDARDRRGVLPGIPKSGKAWSQEKPWNENTERDFEVPEGLGYVFAQPLPAGDYVFHQYSVKCINHTYYIPEGFRIEFSIHPGEVTYIGEVRYVNQFKKNMFGGIVPNGPDIQFFGFAERDLPLIYEKTPVAKDLPVREQILSWGGALQDSSGPAIE